MKMMMREAARMIMRAEKMRNMTVRKTGMMWRALMAMTETALPVD